MADHQNGSPIEEPEATPAAKPIRAAKPRVRRRVIPATPVASPEADPAAKSAPETTAEEAGEEQRNRHARKKHVPLIESSGPQPGENPNKVRFMVGRVIGTHGLKGELKVRLVTDDPGHLTTVKRVYIGADIAPRRMTGVRFHAGNALMTVSGINDSNQANALKGLPVRIEGRDARPLEEGEFFIFQLVGLRAVLESGEDYGIVEDVMATGANDVLVIRATDGIEVLIPHHRSYVLDVRPNEGVIVVKPLEFAD